MTTDEPNIPDHETPAWAQVNAPPGAPMPLSPGAIERHVLPVMDLLERAADLIHDQWDGVSPDSDGQRWITDYRKLCRDE